MLIFARRPPRGHSTIGDPKLCEGFVAIWLCARKEFADNRFQLLFIYTDAVLANQLVLILLQWLAPHPGYYHVLVSPCQMSFIRELNIQALNGILMHALTPMSDEHDCLVRLMAA